MCLTIPKKVVELCPNREVLVELLDGTRQKVKSIIDLEVGDYCLTQQNVAIEKMAPEEANTIRELLQREVVK